MQVWWPLSSRVRMERHLVGYWKESVSIFQSLCLGRVANYNLWVWLHIWMIQFRSHTHAVCVHNALDICVLHLWLYIDCSCLARYIHRQQGSQWTSYCEDVRNTRNSRDVKTPDSLVGGGFATVVGLSCVFVCSSDSGRCWTVQRRIIAWWPKIMPLSKPWWYQGGAEV